MGEIRFVGTGETRGYPYLVCKKIQYMPCSSQIKSEMLPEIHTMEKLYLLNSIIHFQIISCVLYVLVSLVKAPLT